MNRAVQANTQARPADLCRFNDALAHQKAVDKAYDELEAARKKVGPACCGGTGALLHCWLHLQLTACFLRLKAACACGAPT